MEPKGGWEALGGLEDWHRHCCPQTPLISPGSVDTKKLLLPLNVQRASYSIQLSGTGLGAITWSRRDQTWGRRGEAAPAQVSELLTPIHSPGPLRPSALLMDLDGKGEEGEAWSIPQDSESIAPQ